VRREALRAELGARFGHECQILAARSGDEAVALFDELTREAVSGYAEVIESGVKDGSFRRTNVPFLFLAIIGMCEFFINGMPILRIAMGKDFDQRAISARYREFICELLLDGLTAK